MVMVATDTTSICLGSIRLVFHTATFQQGTTKLALTGKNGIQALCTRVLLDQLVLSALLPQTHQRSKIAIPVESGPPTEQ